MSELERAAATFRSCEHPGDRMVATLSDGLLFINCDSETDNAGVFLERDEACRLMFRLGELIMAMPRTACPGCVRAA